MSTRYIPAGAGSGKTYKLTHDLADMLTREENPVEASRVILTTFTRSAASDFVRRAREVLINEKLNPAKAAELDGALIGTVHSVCERFIKKYWYRLDLHLPLNILSDEDRKLFMSRTAENAADDDDVKFFTRFAQEYGLESDFWKGYVESIIEKKYSFDVRNLAASRDMSCRDIAAVFKEDAADMEADLDGFLKKLVTAIKEINREKESRGKRPEHRDVQQEATTLLESGVLYRKAAKVLDWAAEGAEKTKGFWFNTFNPAEYDQVKSAAKAVLLSTSSREERQECVRKLFALAGHWEKDYQDFKAANRLLDYNDLEQKFLQILYDQHFRDIRDDIAASYDVMMVDEFQDSNPVQIKIFRKMMELVGETVLVGDSKQAIYGFRGTESSLVDEFIQEIADQRPIKKSFRSRRELVESANAVFCKAFGHKQRPVYPDDDSMPYDTVSLFPARTEPAGLGPALQHWNTPAPAGNSVRNNYATVGKKIHELVTSGTCMVVRRKDDDGNEIPEPIQYRDIAILLRNGLGIGSAVRDLRKAGVPVSVLENDFIGRAEVQLILSLVRYVFDKKDEGAKADILHLIGGLTSEEIIAGSVNGKWGEDVGILFNKLDDLRSRISVLSVSEIVDSLTLELDLFGNSADWGLPDTRIRNIGFMSALAKGYEEQCANINAAPTLPGYLAYVSEYKPERRLVDKTDTVKVLTYHNAKGLDWPMVILDELDSFKTIDPEVFKKGYCGVCNFREGEEVLLHVFPSAPFVPLPILEKIASTTLFDYVGERRIAEERRLLYVGFTRAKDYLVTLGNAKSQFSWPVLCGAAGTPDPDPNRNQFNWHDKHLSEYMDLPLPEEDGTSTERTLRAWAVPGKKEEKANKYRSPSLADGHHAPVAILSNKYRGSKMEQHIQSEDDDSGKAAVCGTCIHRIFAAYDPYKDRKEMEKMARGIIEGMDLTAEFPSPESVIDSAAQLFDWLKKEYGEGTALHELPVLMKQPDGTVIRGEMDLAWALPGGKCVLVDYKSFHGSEDLGAIKAHAVQHGYPDQLKAYKDTLESGECQVLDVLIYYFVLGQVIKFNYNGRMLNRCGRADS
jgi:ATP-dependent exoDNAse (exonuclease V) beta subunit